MARPDGRQLQPSGWRLLTSFEQAQMERRQTARYAALLVLANGGKVLATPEGWADLKRFAARLFKTNKSKGVSQPVSIKIPNSIRYSPPKTVRKFVRLHQKPVRDRDGHLLIPADDWAALNKFGLQGHLKPDFSNLVDLLRKARRRNVQLKGIKIRARRRMYRNEMAKQSRRRNRS